jgi:hypothetical protein
VQIQLFPYAYSYAAPYAGSLGLPTENDFWRVSFRELLPRVPAGEFVTCQPVTSSVGEFLRYSGYRGQAPVEGGEDCRTDRWNVLTPYRLETPGPSRPDVDTSFLALFRKGIKPADNCRAVGSVTRWRYFSRVTISTVARCDLVMDVYPSSGLVLAPDGTGARYLLGGWTSRATDPGVRLAAPYGALGVELPEGWDRRALRLRLDGEAGGVPEVFVNNVPVTATATPTGWEVDVPATTVAVMGERRLAVVLSQPASGDPLLLSRVTVEPF